MAINYPAVGLVINPAADGTVDVPTAHLLNASQFSMMGVTNAAGGTVDDSTYLCYLNLFTVLLTAYYPCLEEYLQPAAAAQAQGPGCQRAEGCCA